MELKEIIMAINNNLGLIEVKNDSVFIMADCRNALLQLAKMLDPEAVDEDKEKEDK